jgi:hypothetical protein
VVLHLPTVASQCAPLAEQAERERQPHLGYLEALLAAELVGCLRPIANRKAVHADHIVRERDSEAHGSFYSPSNVEEGSGSARSCRPTQQAVL